MNYLKKLLNDNEVTLLLITITTVVFLWQTIRFFGDTSALSIYQAGGVLGVNLKLNEIYRLITPIFVHIGLIHFLTNMITLYATGPIIEKLYGGPKYFMIYLICGIIGNLIASIFSPFSVSAGASTSLFGLFSILTMNGMYHKDPIVSVIGKSYGSLIAFNLILNLTQPNVSLAGHIGGLIGGLICYKLFKTEY